MSQGGLKSTVGAPSSQRSQPLSLCRILCGFVSSSISASAILDAEWSSLKFQSTPSSAFQHWRELLSPHITSVRNEEYHRLIGQSARKWQAKEHAPPILDHSSSLAGSIGLFLVHIRCGIRQGLRLTCGTFFASLAWTLCERLIPTLLPPSPWKHSNVL
ncbi:hypothetical protein F4859DRAFT_460959 [Xylaria cf. heliscus]|nr:hypothetical protein F4859DRAFT_460959 [Xylaria cf. heliscus]